MIKDEKILEEVEKVLRDDTFGLIMDFQNTKTEVEAITYPYCCHMDFEYFISWKDKAHKDIVVGFNWINEPFVFTLDTYKDVEWEGAKRLEPKIIEIIKKIYFDQLEDWEAKLM